MLNSEPEHNMNYEYTGKYSFANGKTRPKNPKLTTEFKNKINQK